MRDTGMDENTSKSGASQRDDQFSWKRQVLQGFDQKLPTTIERGGCCILAQNIFPLCERE